MRWSGFLHASSSLHYEVTQSSKNHVIKGNMSSAPSIDCASSPLVSLVKANGLAFWELTLVLFASLIDSEISFTQIPLMLIVLVLHFFKKSALDHIKFAHFLCSFIKLRLYLD
jgi:hypothetical protein